MSALGSKFDRSWQLFVSSFQIISRNRKLLLFPILAFACTLVIVLFFVAPMVLVPTGQPWASAEHWKAVGSRFGDMVPARGGSRHFAVNGKTSAYLAAVYLVSMFCATFFNVAFYNEIMKALAGKTVSIRAGLSFACSRILSILMWSLFAGIVGLVIKGLEERFGWVGRFVMRFVGVVWSVASVFVIPVIVRQESANPVEMLRNSASTLKKTWGEALIGFVGITFGSWIALFCSAVFIAGAVMLSLWLNHPFLLVPVIGGWLIALVVFCYALSVANHVFRCALYLYASDGVLPAPFTPELIEGAWKVKKS